MESYTTQVFATKNPKDIGCVGTGAPLVEIHRRDDFTLLGYLLLVEEVTYNRFGGRNRWQILYAVLKDGIIVLLEDDEEDMERYDLYHEERPKRSLFDGKYNGERRRAFLLDKEGDPIDFILREPKGDCLLAWRDAYKTSLFLAHSWGGEVKTPSVEGVYTIIDDYLAVNRGGAYVLIKRDGDMITGFDDLERVKEFVSSKAAEEVFESPFEEVAPSEGRPCRRRRRRPEPWEEPQDCGLLEEAPVASFDGSDE